MTVGIAVRMAIHGIALIGRQNSDDKSGQFVRPAWESTPLLTIRVTTVDKPCLHPLVRPFEAVTVIVVLGPGTHTPVSTLPQVQVVF